jgi:hypothetical protein
VSNEKDAHWIEMPGWAGMNFTHDVPKCLRESSRWLTYWMDLGIIMHKHRSKMYKSIKVSSLAWTWSSSNMYCTPKSPNISIWWKESFIIHFWMELIHFWTASRMRGLVTA